MGSERFMDTQHPHTLSRSYDEPEVAAAGAHNVTISGRDATHAPLPHIRARLSAPEEPQIVVALG